LSALRLIILLAGTLLVGCGPIVSGVEIVNANIALSSAETAGAKKTAIYEYVSAREYLQKAREENGYSDFWAARIYAEKALDYATKARKRAESSAQTEQPVVLPEHPATPAAP